MEQTGPIHEQYEESSATDHPPTHPPTSQQTHAPVARTLPPLTSYYETARF